MKIAVLTLLVVLVTSQDVDQVEETTVELCGNSTEESCDAFNSTEVPTEPPTEVTTAASKKVTSKKPKTTTAKSVTKKTPAKNGSNILSPQADCTCDLTRGGCEMNCCCDVDCSESQRAVFTECAVLADADNMDCVPPQLVFRSNSDQTVLSEGMLCVVQQNTHVSTNYRDVPVVRTLTALKAKIDNQKYYSWAKPQPSMAVFDPESAYKDGSPLWTTDNSTITTLALPTTGAFSTECVGILAAKYLVDVETSCTVFLRNKTDCLTSSYTNFTVISSPRNFNFTGPQECTEDICLPIRQFLCAKFCVEGKVPRSSYISSTQTCINVVESVEYRIYHNGSQGVVELKAFFTLANFTVRDDQLVRKQHRVTFKWAGSNGEKIVRVSGHPGYKKGRPVISGKKTGKTITLNGSESEWINVAVAGPSGFCEKRHNIMFGENLQSQCVAKVSGTCKQIQNQLWQAMLGPGGNMSEMVVSAYGDPRESDVEAWVPLITADLPPLPSLVSAVDIVVIHTLVGHATKPQTKIIGVFLSQSSKTTCATNLNRVLVKVSVKFVDKTVAPVTKFAPPPVYEIKLPQDFFYPFLSSGGTSLPQSIAVVLVVVKCLF